MGWTRSAIVVGVALAGCGDEPGGEACDYEPDPCAGDTICFARFCEPAFGRRYDISQIHVELPPTDGTQPWDLIGLPDVFVEVIGNGRVIGRAPTAWETTSATFPGPFSFDVDHGSSMTVKVFDEDPETMTNQVAALCSAIDIPVEMLRLRRLTCEGDGGGVAVTLLIRPAID